MGAAIAYYTFFSIAPLLVITMAIAGFSLEQWLLKAKYTPRLEACWGKWALQHFKAWFKVLANQQKGSLLRS
jgi:membrane protein